MLFYFVLVYHKLSGEFSVEPNSLHSNTTVLDIIDGHDAK